MNYIGIAKFEEETLYGIYNKGNVELLKENQINISSDDIVNIREEDGFEYNSRQKYLDDAEAIHYKLLYDKLIDSNISRKDVVNEEILYIVDHNNYLQVSLIKTVDVNNKLEIKVEDSEKIENDSLKMEELNFISGILEILDNKYGDDNIYEMKRFYEKSDAIDDISDRLILLKGKEFFSNLHKEWVKCRNTVGDVFLIKLDPYEIKITLESYFEIAIEPIIGDYIEKFDNIAEKFTEFDKLIVISDMSRYSEFTEALDDLYQIDGNYIKYNNKLILEGLTICSWKKGNSDNLFNVEVISAPEDWIKILINYSGQKYELLEKDAGGRVFDKPVNIEIGNTINDKIVFELLKEFKGQNKEKSIKEIELRLPFWKYKEALKINARLDFSNDLVLQIEDVLTEYKIKYQITLN